MNKQILEMTIKELDKKELMKTSVKIGGVILAGKVVKDIGNSMYNGVKKNSKKVKENKIKLKVNKNKIKNSREYLEKIKKQEVETKTKQEKIRKYKKIKQVEKDITYLEEKVKTHKKNIAKHSGLAIAEIITLPVILGITGVAGCKIMEVERSACREACDEIESTYRRIDYDMQEYEL